MKYLNEVVYEGAYALDATMFEFILRMNLLFRKKKNVLIRH